MSYYANAGIPWFDHYRDDLSALSGSAVLDNAQSVFALGKAKGEKPLPENSSMEPEFIVQYGNARWPDEVREFVERQLAIFLLESLTDDNGYTRSKTTRPSATVAFFGVLFPAVSDCRGFSRALRAVGALLARRRVLLDQP